MSALSRLLYCTIIVWRKDYISFNQNKAGICHMLTLNHEAINAEEQLKRGDSVFAFTRELLRLRREDPCLSEGRLFPCEDKPGVLAYERRSDNRSVLVVCNLTAEDQSYPCPEGYADGKVLLSNCPGSCYTADGRLMPYECAILEKP